MSRGKINLFPIAGSSLPVPAAFQAYSGPVRNAGQSPSGLFTLSYTPGDDMLVYGTLSYGSKSAGFNLVAPLSPSLVVLPPSTLNLKPENAVNYEMGFKDQFLDSKLQINLAGYWTDLSNYQANAVGLVLISNAQNVGPVRKGRAPANLCLELFQDIAARAWHNSGGWIHRLDRAGLADDRSRILFDQAFALQAAAHVYAATGWPEARHWADRTLRFLDTSMSIYTGGFRSVAEGIIEPLQQCPHMHYFEGLLALWEVFGESEYATRAAVLFRHFERRFVDHDGRLTELYLADWTPHGFARDVFVPGYHFEWSWLCSEYARLSGAALPAVAERLFKRANAVGMGQDGLVVELVDAQGAETSTSRKLDAIERAETDDKWVRIRTWHADGSVFIEVIDSGQGIELGTEERVVETFYSNRPGGLGMGLAICRAIVEEHGGVLEAKNTRDAGAAFTISLPEQLEPEQPASSEAPPSL